MPRQSAAEAKTRPSSEPKPDNNVNLAKPLPLKPPVGIIILPSPPRLPDQDGEDSPPSSTSDSQTPSSSLPDLPGAERTLSRRQTTSTSALNVKFAPLPQLAPRKRRSTTPMGIASRATIMRRRRAGTPGYDMNGDPLPPTPPMWTEEEVERHTQRILAERGGAQSSPRENDIDDPFASLGKMVKGVWRKMNHKKPGEEKGSGEEKGGVVVAERLVLAPISGDKDNTPSREEEGGVWEEEVGDRFPLNVSQTETIVEGQYTWSAAHLKPSLEDTDGSASDDASAREHTLSSTEGTEEEASILDSHHSGS